MNSAIEIVFTCSQQRKDSKTEAEEGVVCTCREFASTFSEIVLKEPKKSTAEVRQRVPK